MSALELEDGKFEIVVLSFDRISRTKSDLSLTRIGKDRFLKKKKIAVDTLILVHAVYFRPVNLYKFSSLEMKSKSFSHPIAFDRRVKCLTAVSFNSPEIIRVPLELDDRKKIDRELIGR